MMKVLCNEAYGGDVLRISFGRSSFPFPIAQSWVCSVNSLLCFVYHDEDAEELSFDHLAVCGFKSSTSSLTIEFQ